MSDLRKAAEQVSEAWNWDWSEPRNKALKERIDALRQALAQPEQEPVGYVTIENISSWAQVPSIRWFKKLTEGQLYTAPPKREWVGLEDEDIATVKNEFNRGALWAEQVLKEKNGG